MPVRLRLSCHTLLIIVLVRPNFFRQMRRAQREVEKSAPVCNRCMCCLWGVVDGGVGGRGSASRGHSADVPRDEGGAERDRRCDVVDGCDAGAAAGQRRLDQNQRLSGADSCAEPVVRRRQRVCQRPHTHTRLTALCPGPPGWAGIRKVKPIWILLEQETVSGSGISWAIWKSASRSRQITTPVPHHSVFYRPDALPATQPTASKHWRHEYIAIT